MRMPPVILFAEFEGVLQPQGATARLLAFGTTLSELLGPHMQAVDIVVSDRRALREPLEALRGRFPSDVASRVVDSVYLPELTNTAWSDYFSALATRYELIKLWMNRKRPGQSNEWLAMEQGSQIDSWPIAERAHVVWGSLGNPKVRREFAEKLSVQIRHAQTLSQS